MQTRVGPLHCASCACPHLIPPALQAGQCLLLSELLQHRVHSLGPLLISVQAAVQSHSAAVRRTEHVREPSQQRGDVRGNPPDLRPVDLQPGAGGAAGACGHREEVVSGWRRRDWPQVEAPHRVINAGSYLPGRWKLFMRRSSASTLSDQPGLDIFNLLSVRHQLRLPHTSVQVLTRPDHTARTDQTRTSVVDPLR